VQRRGRESIIFLCSHTAGEMLAGTPSGHVLNVGDEMRAIVTCECCGHRQAVARPIGRPEAFHVVCHECEGILRVEVTADDLTTAQKSVGRSRKTHV
jgi:hypothetical protein